MPVPDYQVMMLSVLAVSAAGDVRSGDAKERLGAQMQSARVNNGFLKFLAEFLLFKERAAEGAARLPWRHQLDAARRSGHLF